MVKDDKLRNLDWVKIQNIVIDNLRTVWNNIKIDITQKLNGIEKSNGQIVSFGGFDEFWKCEVNSEPHYLHVQVDCSEFLGKKSNNILININIWGMNGKKIPVIIDISQVSTTCTI